MPLQIKHSVIFPFLLLLLSACRDQRPGAQQDILLRAFRQCGQESGITGLSWFTEENGRITGENYADDAQDKAIVSAQDILLHFMAPQLLDRMIRDSSVNGQDSVCGPFKVKDLIILPADHYDMTTGQMGLPDARAASVIRKNKKVNGDSLLQRFSEGLSLQSGNSMKRLFRNLGKLSDHFDQAYPEYASPGGAIADVLPTWYTRGLSGFFGWNILKFQGHTVLWNCFTEGSVTILVIKSPEKKAFAAVGYTGHSLLSPLDLNRKDLLQSPLGLAFVKALYLPAAMDGIDYTKPAAIIYEQLERQQDSSYNFIYHHDLLTHARLYERTGRKKQASLLYSLQQKLMQDSLLVKYENAPVLAEINYVSDDLKAVVPFGLKSAAPVQIFAGGQVRVPHDYNDNIYQYDNVQIFLNDHAGERGNSWLNTHLFQFNYGSDKTRITEGVCAFGDPTDTSYLVEVRIDWEKLSKGRHSAGRNLLANVLVSDCDLDENIRESVLSWTVGPGENFGDLSKYGSVLLTRPSALLNRRSALLNRQPRPGAAKKLYAVQTSHPPIIDGKADREWEQAPWSPVTLPYINTVSPRDNSARFKALFDDRYLYLLFDITDNCKNRLGIVTTDKCWIEDAASGQIVWKMNGDTTENYPSFIARRKVQLPAGKYLLKYASDKGNSYEYWYGKPPGNGIYGAVLYIAK